VLTTAGQRVVWRGTGSDPSSRQAKGPHRPAVAQPGPAGRSGQDRRPVEGRGHLADGEALSVVSAKVCVPHLQSLARERLDALLSGLSNYRVGLVVAPAGSGKTTLLSRFAST